MKRNRKEIWFTLRLYGLAFHRFFPVQLLLVHLRRSWLFIMFWFLLFGMVGGHLFAGLGIPYLFLAPEYMEKVGPESYFIMGMVIGLFTMSYNVASYIFYAHRFPFLATLSRPLYRFSFNNSIIPIAFYVFYAWAIFVELSAEGHTNGWIVLCIVALAGGNAVPFVSGFLWFNRILKPPVLEKLGESLEKSLRRLLIENKSPNQLSEAGYQSVLTYLKNFHSVRWARDSSHYPKGDLLRTLERHQLHAAVLFVSLTVILLSLSLLVDKTYLMIPAGASIVLMLTFYLMIVGAVYSRLRGWTFTFMVAAAVVFNFVSGLPPFQQVHYAYGMDYDSDPAPYSMENLEYWTNDSLLQVDREETIRALEAWKARFPNEERPRLVIVNSSGGGLRSSLWSLAMLQEVDSATQGRMWSRAFLLTGSSGGMVGTAYYREMKKRALAGDTMDPNSLFAYSNMGRDILNPVGFSMVVNDMFFSWKRIRDAGSTYPFDRGLAFEQQLQRNLQNILPTRYTDYAHAERNAEVPWMILSPTIVNEGRRLLISNLGVSYLARNVSEWTSDDPSMEIDGVEMMRFFSAQRADSLRFATALRMSATFPYITPLVSMPSEPRMEVIDAGARDNNGFELSLRFVNEFKDWIRNNTSGVVFVQFLANWEENKEIQETPYQTRGDALIKPIGGVVNSFQSMQDFSASVSLRYAESWVDFPITIRRFRLQTDGEQEIALSWHLTRREIDFIRKSTNSLTVQMELEQLIRELH